MRASFPRVFAGCDSNEEQSNGPNQTQVGHVFAVCVDLSACQIVKLRLFISIFKPSHWMLATAGNARGFEWLVG